MPYPQNMRHEMLRLARTLLKQTRQGTIKWAVTDKEGEFLFSSAKSSMLIQGIFGNYDDENEGEFTLELLNRGGSVAARLEIGAQAYDDLEQITDYKLLEQLYFEVQNKALEIDTTLEDIHRALGMEADSEGMDADSEPTSPDD